MYIKARDRKLYCLAVWKQSIIKKILYLDHCHAVIDFFVIRPPVNLLIISFNIMGIDHTATGSFPVFIGRLPSIKSVDISAGSRGTVLILAEYDYRVFIEFIRIGFFIKRIHSGFLYSFESAHLWRELIPRHHG